MASEPAPPPLVIGSKSGSLTVSIPPPPPAEATLPSPGPETPGSEFSTPPTSPRAEDSPTSPRGAESPYSPTSPRGADSPGPPAPEQPAETSPHVRTASLPDDAVSMLPQVGTASPRPQPDDTVSTPRQVMTASTSTVPDDTVSTPQQARTASPPSLPPDGTVSTPPLLRTVSPPLPPAKLGQPALPPPVQVPPPQYEKASAGTDGSALTFFWDAVARVQEAHASLDEYISKWFGLDQSKYQWALNDYYERTGQEMNSVKGGNPKEKV